MRVRGVPAGARAPRASTPAGGGGSRGRAIRAWSRPPASPPAPRGARARGVRVFVQAPGGGRVGVARRGWRGRPGCVVGVVVGAGAGRARAPWSRRWRRDSSWFGTFRPTRKCRQLDVSILFGYGFGRLVV